MQNQYELSQRPLDLAAVDNRQRWQLRPPAEFPSPRADEWGYDPYGLWQVFPVVDEVKLCLRYIPPGDFLMGSPEDEPERSSEAPPQTDES